MQVLCRRSNSAEGNNKVCCAVCGQAFDIYWERSSKAEREATTAMIHAALIEHHGTSQTEEVHPRSGFLLPSWSGSLRFSGAALLGGVREWDT